MIEREGERAGGRAGKNEWAQMWRAEPAAEWVVYVFSAREWSWVEMTDTTAVVLGTGAGLAECWKLGTGAGFGVRGGVGNIRMTRGPWTRIWYQQLDGWFAAACLRIR